MVILVATGAGSQQHQQRPQPFASGLDNVFADLADQGNVGMQLLMDALINPAKIVVNGELKRSVLSVRHLANLVGRNAASYLVHRQLSIAGLPSHCSRAREVTRHKQQGPLVANKDSNACQQARTSLKFRPCLKIRCGVPFCHGSQAYSQSGYESCP